MNSLTAPATPAVIALFSTLSLCVLIFSIIRRLARKIGLRHLRLASAYLAKRDYDKARLHAEAFLSLIRRRVLLKHLLWFFSRNRTDPEAIALNCLGASEAHFGNYASANEHFDASIKLAPNFASPQFNKGSLLLKTGTRSQAKPFFDQARKLGHPVTGIDTVMFPPIEFTKPYTIVEDAPTKSPLVPEPLYEVRMLNDDKTPMAFVVTVLEHVFNKNYTESKNIMLEVHKNGFGTCGTYSRTEAVVKVFEVERRSREHGHQLICEVVPVKTA